MLHPASAEPPETLSSPSSTATFRRDGDIVDRGILRDSDTILEQTELLGKLNLREKELLSAGS